jgi:Protein of unknown function (DUF1501)
MHCGRFLLAPLTRRQMLRRCANGFGSVALAGLLAHESRAGLRGEGVAGLPHMRAKAKNVIFLFMDGGPSQLDTFDPKPRLAKEHGQPIKMKTPATQFNNVGNVLKSPWAFRPRGQCGTPVSDLFPEVAQCVDDLAIVRSMTSEFSEHTNANYFIHSGHGQQGRPSMGAWATYGLGSEGQNLPGFIVLDSGLIPPGGLDCFSNGFLPATFQGSVFQHGPEPVAYLRPQESVALRQEQKLTLLHHLDEAGMHRHAHEDKIEAAIANYELAFRMQTAVPELLDLSRESNATKRLYGVDSEYAPTQIFASQCLLARRLVERGVRFVEVLCPSVGADRWDQHSDLRGGHTRNARATDRPTAALLKDLKSRGLLDETLVIWAGEFGRTPMAQGSDGRDHNPFGFSIWLAGGGIKGGTIYGQTDDYGYYAIENKVEMYDLHATMLHLLGIDHKRLTVRFGGRDMRLTDVHGEVVTGIVA